MVVPPLVMPWISLSRLPEDLVMSGPINPVVWPCTLRGPSVHYLLEFEQLKVSRMKTNYSAICERLTDASHLASAGRPAPDMEVQLANENGLPVASGETGES